MASVYFEGKKRKIADEVIKTLFAIPSTPFNLAYWEKYHVDTQCIDMGMEIPVLGDIEATINLGASDSPEVHQVDEFNIHNFSVNRELWDKITG